MMFKSKAKKEQKKKQVRIRQLERVINKDLYKNLEDKYTPNFQQLGISFPKSQLLFFERLLSLFTNPLLETRDFIFDMDSDGEDYITFTPEFVDTLFLTEYPEKKELFKHTKFYSIQNNKLTPTNRTLHTFSDSLFSENAQLFSPHISKLTKHYTIRQYLVQKLLPDMYVNCLSDKQLLTYLYEKDTYTTDMSYEFYDYIYNVHLDSLVHNIVIKQCLVRNMSENDANVFYHELKELVFTKITVTFNAIFSIIISLNDPEYFENIYSLVPILKSHEYNSLLSGDKKLLFQTKVDLIFKQTITQNSNNNKQLVSNRLDKLIT